MQIHELNTFTGTLGAGAYLAVDDGSDTGKLSTQALLSSTESEISTLDTRIDNIISGVTVDSEVIDARLGADGVTYGTLGTAIRTQFTDVKDDIYDTGTGKYLFEDGSLSAYTGEKNSYAGRIRTFNPLSKDVVSITTESGYWYGIFAFNNGTYVGWWDGSAWSTSSLVWIQASETKLTKAMRAYDLYIVVRRSDNGTIAVSEGENLILTLCTSRTALIDISLTAKYCSGVYDYSPDNWEIGSIYVDDGNNYDSNTHALRTPFTNKFRVESKDAVFGSTNTAVTSVLAFKYTDNAYVERLGSVGETEPLTLEKGYDYRLLLLFSSDLVITTETIPTYADGAFMYGEELYDISSKLLHDDSINYSINSGCIKNKIGLTELGTLSGAQAFCIYNDNYYSTDGSNLYEQDSSFSLVSTTALSLGHGNALQLGSNGIAYASGWDDNSVYAVDLANKTITATYALPVSGYTTCAVDDVNGLMYIFHRTSYPSTQDYYNLVVYDYVNDTTISTKKIPRKIAAMQACDFVEGKLFVLYGTGIEAKPNGYIVLNTNGDIIFEYVIGKFSDVEPEGVSVDRDTFDVYISYVNAKVYKVE